MKLSKDISSELYQQYKSIARDDFQKRIRFVERNIKQLEDLPFSQYIEIHCEYLFALYEVAAYYQYITKSDALIELVIEENIFEYKGLNIYAELLHRKAKAYYHVIDYVNANKIFKALVKIDDHPNYYKEDYIKNKIDYLRYKSQRLRAASIVMFLFSAIIIAVELLAVRSFYPDWVTVIETIRNISFLTGLFIFIYIETSIRSNASEAFQKLVKQNSQ